MKKIMVFILAVLFCFVAEASAIEIKVITVVTGGEIQATGSYFAQGGDNPYFENQYQSDYWIKTEQTAGLAMTSAFSGALSTQEQMEIMGSEDSFGRFVTKTGTGTLINTTDDSGITTGVLNQNAIGFGGQIDSGMITTGFETANGLIGSLSGQGVGVIKAGAVGQTITGTNEPGTNPSVTERSEFHLVVGPGQFQTQIQFSFPK